MVYINVFGSFASKLQKLMAELFKNIYNQDFFNQFTKIIKQVIPDFDTQSFLQHIFDVDWDNKELKQRMRHITVVLKNHLSEDYEKNVNFIFKIIDQLEKNNISEKSIEYMFFPDFIEVYGLDNYTISVKAIEKTTQFTSCEFAVRPFIINYSSTMIPQLFEWSNHKHAMVRRLATEGCRPRLPWGIGIPALKENPSEILPILENLKNDVSESVRRSVANNLNDISKDNPVIVIDIVKNWQGKTVEVDKLLKHASRTLLKQGNQEIMTLFGFGAVDKIKINSFKIQTPNVKIGEALAFSFNLLNTDIVAAKIRLEYGLYYQKANGTLAKKVFKISEKVYAKNSLTEILRKQSFKIITTRKFHLGEHQVSIIVNGIEFEKLSFNLIA
ncbi:DNA alkylation repair protein [Tenacibaculum soleae]|uniref:DNA alkylation repair protein n=1 Tax=Tenacibaculum soleae TaxID=447689 RepID=UPI0026E3879D|nr:DNA alkylation repair protein [Tenacibaculum soleae]MDO6743234.1 DNA alkylation repair protein [Tenacibaculum soleae]